MPTVWPPLRALRKNRMKWGKTDPQSSKDAKDAIYRKVGILCPGWGCRLSDPLLTARERLEVVFSPDVLRAIDELISETVAVELDRRVNVQGDEWLTYEQASERW